MYVQGTSFPNLTPGTGGRVSSRVTPAEPWLAANLLHLQLFNDTLTIKYKLRLMPAALQMGRRCPGRWSTSLWSQGLDERFMAIPFMMDRHG